MTCIVGLVHNKKVYIGGDSAYVDGWLGLAIRPNEKVFEKNGVIFGLSGDPRALDLLKYHLVIPEIPENIDHYMHTAFIDAVRDCFKSGGYAEKENDSESFGSYFMVGIGGRLFEVYGNYTVSECFEYSAIGTGGQLAIGALYATPTKKPVERIRLALSAAEKFNAGVKGPFRILAN